MGWLFATLLSKTDFSFAILLATFEPLEIYQSCRMLTGWPYLSCMNEKWNKQTVANPLRVKMGFDFAQKLSESTFSKRCFQNWFGHYFFCFNKTFAAQFALEIITKPWVCIFSQLGSVNAENCQQSQAVSAEWMGFFFKFVYKHSQQFRLQWSYQDGESYCKNFNFIKISSSFPRVFIHFQEFISSPMDSPWFGPLKSRSCMVKLCTA